MNKTLSADTDIMSCDLVY